MSTPETTRETAGDTPANAPSDDAPTVEELDKKYAEDTPDTEFAALLEESDKQSHREVSTGDKVTGTIREIGDSTAFIDFGGRSEASIDIQELRDESGELKYKAGDTIEAFVASTDGEIRLAFSLRVSSRQLLRQAHQNDMPIAGKVTGFNTGGLVVNIGGLRAFCPMSQIDTGYCDDPASYAGQTHNFKIVELRGRNNVVVSRRAYLEEENRKKADEMRQKLSEGEERTGTITRIERFGSFVDLGGVEGLVHVSEISHTRVENPRSVLKKGEEVRVKIIGLKNLGKKNERISLSIKALERDPWDTVAERYQSGSIITGKVVSIQNFGAFVEIEPGIEGLVHISQFVSGKRISNPSEVVSVGQEVKTLIREIDLGKKRISLSMRAVEERDRQTAEIEDMAAFKSKQTQESQSDNAMADALRRAGLA
ncbi:MAG: S1 RNA-binding domain-containing protein [Gemmatimonadetes bacterium]|nr:S1 RNA-binding domain-containing protein [Gemmatimonadota bacterium]